MASQDTTGNNSRKRTSTPSSEGSADAEPLGKRQRFADPGDGNRSTLWRTLQINVLDALFKEQYGTLTPDGKWVMDFTLRRPMREVDFQQEREEEYNRLVEQDDWSLQDSARNLPCGEIACPRCPQRFGMQRNADAHAEEAHPVRAARAVREDRVFALKNFSGTGLSYVCPVVGCGKMFKGKDVTKHLLENVKAGGHAANQLERLENGMWRDLGPKTGAAVAPGPAKKRPAVKTQTAAVEEAEEEGPVEEVGEEGSAEEEGEEGPAKEEAPVVDGKADPKKPAPPDKLITPDETPLPPRNPVARHEPGAGKPYVCPVRGCGARFKNSGISYHLGLKQTVRGGHCEQVLKLAEDGWWDVVPGVTKPAAKAKAKA
jgi:uncharacterized C2H2 Zn-finger protein